MTVDIERHADVFRAPSNPDRQALFLGPMSCCAPGKVRAAEVRRGLSAFFKG